MDAVLSRRLALEHHLQYNHYPPLIQPWMVDLAEAAIDAAESGEEIFSLTHNNQTKQFETDEVLDDLHLWDMVELDNAEIV